MYNISILRNLGSSKILLVEADSIKAQRQAEALASGGASVEVVEYEFQAFSRLGTPNHGYNLVFFGNEPFHPDSLSESDVLD